MQSVEFDVTLYWHDGGSINLGGVRAGSAEEAERIALERYRAESKAQAEEIETGGGFQVEATRV